MKSGLLLIFIFSFYAKLLPAVAQELPSAEAIEFNVRPTAIEQLDSLPSSFEVPNFIEYKASLPKYEYSCQLNEYFGPSAGEPIQSVLREIDVQNLPTDEDFNAQLSNLIPRVLYEGIIKLSILNPVLARLVYERSLVLPIKFVCKNISGEIGAAAAASKQFYFYGRRLVHLDAIVVQLLDKGPRYQGNKDVDALSAARDLFHELLHHLAHPDDIRSHVDLDFVNGASQDVVYACSNFVFDPLDAVSDKFNKMLEKYRPGSMQYYTQYTENYPASLARKIYGQKFISYYKIKRNESFRVGEIFAFNHAQCVTCASVRLKINKKGKFSDELELVSDSNIVNQCLSRTKDIYTSEVENFINSNQRKPRALERLAY